MLFSKVTHDIVFHKDIFIILFVLTKCSCIINYCKKIYNVFIFIRNETRDTTAKMATGSDELGKS